MKHRKPLPYTQNTRGHWVPYAFAVSETVDVHADTEMMVEALAHFSPDEAFLRTFPTMRAVSALCRIAKHRNSPDAPNAFALWIDQLRRAKSVDWNAVHDRLSAVEKTLMSDPCGAYPICDEETKAAYRDAVRRMAVKQRITEEAAAERVLSCASASDGRKSEISYHLFPPQKHNTGIGWYLLFFGAAFLFSLLTVILLRPYGVLSSIAVGCALLLPYYALIREAVNILSVRWLRAGYVPVLRLQADAAVIASKARTLTVITSLLRGGEHDLELCENLERFYLRNLGDGLYFGLLCDLPTSEKELTEEDTAHIMAARERIAHLNALYGEHFCFFVRRRIYSDGEGCYMGWERKRGAVLELSGYLRGRNAESFLYSSCPKEIGRITYVCTLDEDTQLPPEAIHTMLGAMMHPHNRPDIRDGAVRAGCAMLQPSMAVTLEGASATRFTLLCTGRGGMDPYSRYHTDGESLLFGEGSFCGKGIFDVDAFLAVLDGAFPDHTVLSHDFLEGARLGCRNIPAVTFSDTIPTTPGAYFARQGRWVRGDVQALRFAFPHHKNARGETVVNPVSPAARLRIIDHVLHALTPAAILRAVLIIACLPLPTVICAVLWLLLFSSYLLRPIGLCLRTWAWRALFRQFFGTVYTDLRQALYWLFFRIVFAAEEGWVNTRAIVTALYRMLISGHHLLAWVTAGEREAGSKKSSCRASYRAMRISVIIGAVLVILSPHPTAKVLGLLWICAPW
ncbi:MAG: hypothetical protein J6S41_04355, partial [Clostridia bacterium]|nr:hypothetical protein [Clostridia bacterium]